MSISEALLRLRETEQGPRDAAGPCGMDQDTDGRTRAPFSWDTRKSGRWGRVRDLHDESGGIRAPRDESGRGGTNQVGRIRDPMR